MLTFITSLALLLAPPEGARNQRQQGTLKAGDVAPTFTLQDVEGKKTVKLDVARIQKYQTTDFQFGMVDRLLADPDKAASLTTKALKVLVTDSDGNPVPKAPVLRPLVVCVASPAPVSVAVSVKVWAATGVAANPIRAAAIERAIIQREVIAVSSSTGVSD